MLTVCVMVYSSQPNPLNSMPSDFMQKERKAQEAGPSEGGKGLPADINLQSAKHNSSNQPTVGTVVAGPSRDALQHAVLLKNAYAVYAATQLSLFRSKLWVYMRAALMDRSLPSKQTDSLVQTRTA